MVYTIGHSTHSLEKFSALLGTVKGKATLVDVRRYPSSRRYPHFNQEALRSWLAAQNIGYAWMPDLGGFIPASPKSKHMDVPIGIRGFADFADTKKFSVHLGKLIKIDQPNIVIMCSEGDPAKCHRSIITQAIVARSIPVTHILPDGSHLKVTP